VGVAERGQQGDALVADLLPVLAQPLDDGVEVAGVPQHDRVQDEAERGELVFLAFPLRLVDLTASTPHPARSPVGPDAPTPDRSGSGPDQHVLAHPFPCSPAGSCARGSDQRCDGRANTSRRPNARCSCSGTHTTYASRSTVPSASSGFA
jgi:hypothetical protein